MNIFGLSMTLSILIAAYNNRLEPLVCSLLEQAKNARIDCEILIHENGEDPEIERSNRSLGDIPGVSIDFRRAAPNRASSRNWLAERARGAYLLFIDGDSFPPSEQFISNYVRNFREDAVVIGGTAYRAEKPEPDRLLRWVYGRRREVKSAAARNQNPYRAFSSFNFVLPSALKSVARFDESIQGYGHEDTMLGYSLKHRCIRVVHIDNPLYHDGIDPSGLFLEKSLEAVHNLKTLIDQGRIDEDVSLFRWMKRIETSGLRGLYLALWTALRMPIARSLCGARPSLIAFDFLRLGHLISLRKQSGAKMNSEPGKRPY